MRSRDDVHWRWLEKKDANNEPSIGKLHLSVSLAVFKQNYAQLYAILEKAVTDGIILQCKLLRFDKVEATSQKRNAKLAELKREENVATLERIVKIDQERKQLSAADKTCKRVEQLPCTIYLFDEMKKNNFKKLVMLCQLIETILQNQPCGDAKFFCKSDIEIKGTHFAFRQDRLQEDTAYIPAFDEKASLLEKAGRASKHFLVLSQQLSQPVKQKQNFVSTHPASYFSKKAQPRSLSERADFLPEPPSSCCVIL